LTLPFEVLENFLFSSFHTVFKIFSL